MKQPKHEITPDTKLNPGLRKDVGELRGGIVQAAEKNKLPARFKVEPHLHRPAMIFTDTATGRTTTVPLFAYGSVREALNELFGDGPGNGSK